MIKYIIITFLFFNIIKADDISNLILKIKNAPVENKRVLINQLKIKLRSSNQTKRHNAIEKLKKLQNSNHSPNIKMNQHRYIKHSNNINNMSNQIKEHSKEINVKNNLHKDL